MPEKSAYLPYIYIKYRNSLEKLFWSLKTCNFLQIKKLFLLGEVSLFLLDFASGLLVNLLYLLSILWFIVLTHNPLVDSSSLSGPTK